MVNRNRSPQQRAYFAWQRARAHCENARIRHETLVARNADAAAIVSIEAVLLQAIRDEQVARDAYYAMNGNAPPGYRG